MVARFEAYAQLARVHAVAGYAALVVYAKHVCAELGEHLDYLEQLPGLVVKLHGERADASVLVETTVDDAVQDVHVDVAAAHQADGLLALDGHFAEHRRCDAHRSGTLGYHLLLLHEAQYGGANLVFGHKSYLVNIFRAYFISKVARCFHGDTVRNGRYVGKSLGVMVAYALVHAGRAGRLDAVHLHVGLQRLYGVSHSADEPAAAYWHHDGLQVGQLVEQFKAYCALSGDYVVVVEGVDEGVAVLVAQLECALISVVIHAGNEANLRPQAACGLNLADWRALGQAY